MKHITRQLSLISGLKRLGWGLLLLLSMPMTAQVQIKDTVTFAVFGNSISTYYDFLPSGYAVYYTAARELSAGMQLGDTYWTRSICFEMYCRNSSEVNVSCCPSE